MKFVVTCGWPPPAHQELLLELDDATGQEMALLLMGIASANLVIEGSCVLHLAPIGPQILLPVFGAPSPGEGFTKVSGTIPFLAAPVAIKLQAAVSDSTTGSGMTVTNALDLSLIP